MGGDQKAIKVKARLPATRHLASGAVSTHLLVGVALVPLALGIWGLASMLSGAPPNKKVESVPVSEGEWFEVERRSFDLSIVATGELEAKKQVEIKSQIKHETAIVEVVDEGTFVEEGDQLLRLDADEIEDDIEQEELKLASARAEQIAAEQKLLIEQNETESLKKAAEVKLELARLDQAKWRSGEVPQKKRELKLALEKAERKLTRATRDHALSEDLYKEDFISQNELEEYYDAMIDAEDELATARLNIEVYDAYTHEREEKEKNSNVEQAQAELDRTQRKNESKLASAKAELDSKRRTFKIRDSRMEELKDQLGKSVICAPQDGLVVYKSSVGRRRWRGDPIQTGRRVWYNETLILLPDTRQMIATLRVHEALIPQVEVGNEVTVSIDARPGETMAGSVAELAVMAEDGGWINPNLREYKVKVDLPANIEGLKPAMRCSGDIITGHVEDAVAVPVQAVFTDAELHFCYVPAGRGKVRRAEVELGQASETFVEIISGLAPGDRVLMRNPGAGQVSQ